MKSSNQAALKLLAEEIVSCKRCPRLLKHCRDVARIKRKAYSEWDYWGKPVPSFGDPQARLLIVGLAPGAHGANRTGRVFTGDRSGDFLYRALYETGFASQPESRERNDGLTLRDLYITGAARCAPPENKPLPAELARCRSIWACTCSGELSASHKVSILLRTTKREIVSSSPVTRCSRQIAGRIWSRRYLPPG